MDTNTFLGLPQYSVKSGDILVFLWESPKTNHRGWGRTGIFKGPIINGEHPKLVKGLWTRIKKELLSIPSR